MADYNSISKGYDELYGNEQVKKARLIIDNMPWTIDKDWLLLDVGAGTGISTVIFPLPADNKICLDPSEELLKMNPYQKVIGRAEKMPFKDSSFDMVISLTAVHNFDDIEAGIKEMKRVGKKRFIISVLKKSEKSGNIGDMLTSCFKLISVMDEDKDMIYFLEK